MSSETANVNEDLPAFLDCWWYRCTVLLLILPRRNKGPIRDVISQICDHQAEHLIFLLYFLQFSINKQLLDLSALEQRDLFMHTLNFWLQYSHFLREPRQVKQPFYGMHYSSHRGGTTQRLLQLLLKVCRSHSYILLATASLLTKPVAHREEA